MSVLSNNTLAGSSGQGGAGGYEIERSLRFNSVDSSDLRRVHASGGSKSKFTISCWLKRCKSGGYGYLLGRDGSFGIYITASDKLHLDLYAENGSSWAVICDSQAVLRDFSAWYHIVVTLDTSAGTTNADRIKFWLNGVQQTFDFTVYWGGLITGNIDSFNDAASHSIGSSNGSYYSNNYLADYHFIDGQALAATDFGEYDTNNVWQPIKYAGTYGVSVDQSQTWSSAITGTYNGSNDADNLFDGNTSNQTIPATGTSLTFTPSSAVTGITKIRIKLSCDPNHTDEFKINGVDQTGTLTKDSVTRDLDYSVSQLTSIVWSTSSNNHWIALKQISVEVNGSWVVLVDSGVTVSDNSFHLDFSDNSSNAALGTDSSGNSNTWTVNNLSVGAAAVDYSGNGQMPGSWNAAPNDAAAGFDGSIAGPDVPYFAGSGAAFTWTPSTPISYSTNVEMYVGNVGGFRYDLNGGGWVTPTTASWNTIATGSGSITTIKVDRGGSDTYGWHAIKVDGTILVNSAAEFTDALRDTPVNGDSANDTGAGGEITGNYATFNPLQIKANLGTMENGNLTLKASGSYYIEGKSTQEIFSYSNYCELTISGGDSNTDGGFGIGDHDAWVAGGAGSYITYRENGAIISYPGNTTVATVSGYTAGDVLGMAVDTTNIKFYKNGALQGTYAHGKSGTFFAHVINLASNSNAVMDINFGQRAFAYTAPSGYKCLNTANLSDPTIADGSTAFDTKLYTGTGSSQDITGYNFSPDLAWIKQRSSSRDHMLHDTVRGDNKALYPSQNYAEATTGGVAFGSTGFTLGTDSHVNASSGTFVAWAWDAGSSNTTIAAGGLNSSVYYMSEVWSDDLYTANGPSDAATVTTQSFLSGYPATNPFNGNGNGAHETYAADSHKTIVFRPDTALTGVTKLEYYTNGAYASDVGYNSATSVITGNTTTGWQTLYEGTAITVNYVWAYKNNGQGSFTGVKINGRLLVDSGVTPPTNVPSIASTVRANPSAGFSIAKWNMGSLSSTASVGHGLNAAPAFYMMKDLDSADGWYTYHEGVGNTKYLRLDLDIAATTQSSMWGDTSPDSNTFPVGSTFSGTGDYYAVCFAPVEGYSAFGSYTGNGSADGPMVYTGMRPAFILIKKYSNTGYWMMYDSKRLGYNKVDNYLYANDSGAEGTGAFDIDIVSNGFKIRYSHGYINGSSETYIYAAFAEHPFKTSRAR